MTTRPTDKEIRKMVERMKYCASYIGEDEPRAFQEGAAMLEAWLAERQAARGGVTDEMVEKFVELVCKHSNEEIDYVDVMTPRIRDAIQSIAQPVKVPDGWKLVPIEPTDAMLDHIAGTHFSRLSPEKQAQEIAAYSRMLSAAPAYNGKKETT